jgi:hypothetical protein
MMDIYYTKNSKYEIDMVTRRYRRTPLGNRSGSHSERLAYGDWLPLKDVEDAVEVILGPYASPYLPPEARPRVLRIMHETSTHGIITSPIESMFIGVDA